MRNLFRIFLKIDENYVCVYYEEFVMLNFLCLAHRVILPDNICEKILNFYSLIVRKIPYK